MSLWHCLFNSQERKKWCFGNKEGFIKAEAWERKGKDRGNAEKKSGRIHLDIL